MQDHRDAVWTSLQLPRSARGLTLKKKVLVISIMVVALVIAVVVCGDLPPDTAEGWIDCVLRLQVRCRLHHHWWTTAAVLISIPGILTSPPVSQPPRSSARSISSRVCDKEFWSFLLHSCSLFQFSLNWARRGGYPQKSACKIGIDDSEWWQWRLVTEFRVVYDFDASGSLLREREGRKV